MLPVVKSARFWLMLVALVGAGGLFLLLINFAVMPLWTRHDAEVAVPEIRELLAEDAVFVLREAGLRAELREQPFNPNITADMVVDQNPLPSTMVKPGRRVYYYVNASPKEMISVPDLRTRSEGVASDDIRNAGLVVGEVLYDSLHTPYEGTVTRQTPQGGHMVPRGTRVILWLSPGLGQDNVRVPNVEGMRPAEARRVILERGLWLPESAVRGDTIRWSEPRPGTPLREGTEIKIHTSEPPESYFPPPPPPPQETDSTEVEVVPDSVIESVIEDLILGNPIDDVPEDEPPTDDDDTGDPILPDDPVERPPEDDGGNDGSGSDDGGGG